MADWGQGGRNFGCFLVYRELRAAFPGRRVRVRHDGQIQVTIWSGRGKIWTVAFGWILRLKATRLAHQVVRKARLWVPIRVKVETASGR